MPMAACNLILVTAVEDKALVGDPLFGHVLPLAARGAPPSSCCASCQGAWTALDGALCDKMGLAPSSAACQLDLSPRD